MPEIPEPQAWTPEPGIVPHPHARTQFGEEQTMEEPLHREYGPEPTYLPPPRPARRTLRTALWILVALVLLVGVYVAHGVLSGSSRPADGPPGVVPATGMPN